MGATERSTHWSVRALALAATLVLLLAGFRAWVEPLYRNWGATPEEIAAALPGDDIILGASTNETRAVTIHAPAERVWPWLAQLGQDRGGFYSFDLLENLVGARVPTTDSLRPSAQTWQLGDRLWMYPRERAGGIGYATLRTFLPGRALVFATHAPGVSPEGKEDGSWGFYLVPIDSGSTRLITRGRGGPPPSLLGVAFTRAFFDPAHFAMDRRMMLGLRDVVERGDRGRWKNHLQVLLWTLAFLLWLMSGVHVFRRSAWWRSLGAFILAAAVFEVLTLLQPAIGIGILLLIATAGAARWLERSPAS